MSIPAVGFHLAFAEKTAGAVNIIAASYHGRMPYK